MQMCLEFFGDLTEAQQLQAANEFRRRVTPMIRNPSALLTSIITRVQGGSSGISGATRIASQPAKSPFLAAKPKRSLNAQHFPEALFLENFSSVSSSPFVLYKDATLSRIQSTSALLMSRPCM